MSNNFDNKESRVDYLTGNFTDLLDGINGSYGQALIDELMNRLDQTVIDFLFSLNCSSKFSMLGKRPKKGSKSSFSAK